MIGPASDRPARGLRPAGGFTLIELLTAMTLFLTLGLVLFGLLRSGLGLFQQGESRRSSYERGIALLDEIASDLRAARGGEGWLSPDPDVRFLVDRDREGRQRLRFVRSVPRELSDEASRLAGSLPGGSEDLDFGIRLAAARQGQVRGLRGLAEEAYVSEPAGEGDPAVLALKRAMKAPPGGDTSLFHDENLAGEDAPERLRALAAGLLYFGVECVVLGEEPEFLDEWDSTLARLPSFRHHAGKDSAGDPRDDLFPAAVRITLTIEREDTGGRGAKLDEPISPSDRILRVSNARDLPGPAAAYPFVKIGREWIRVGGKDADRLTASERGARGSVAARHERGARVHAGETLVRWVTLRCRREALR
jgi:hypothetical protein